MTNGARSIPPRSSRQEAAGPYGVINMPGYIGGINWPGGCYDPENHMVYTYSQTNLLTIGNLIPNPEKKMGEFDFVHVNPPGATSPGVQPGNLTVDGIPIVKPPYGRHHRYQSGQGRHAVNGRWRMARRRTISATIRC